MRSGFGRTRHLRTGAAVLVLAGASGCVLDQSDPEETIAFSREAIRYGVGLDNWPSGDAWNAAKRATVRIENKYIHDHYPEYRGLCTGTLLRPRVVLTAAHCVRTNPDDAASGAVQPGELYLFNYALGQTASGGMPPANGGRCTAIGCLQAQEIVIHDSADVALVFLPGYLGYLNGNGAAIYRGATESLADGSASITGYGLTETGSTGDLRAGQTYIGWTSSGEMGTCYDPALGDHGDSGGPLWTAYPPLITAGVAAYKMNSNGCANDTGVATTLRYVNPRLYRYWARSAIAQRTSSLNDPFDGTSLCSPYAPICSWEVVDPADPNVDSSWSISGGQIHQSRNVIGAVAHEGTILLNRRDYYDNGLAYTIIRSADDDSGGLVFRYSDNRHYYLCKADQQNGYVALYKRTQSGMTELARTNATFQWSTGNKVKARARDKELWCQLTTASGTKYEVTATDAGYPVGMIGLYDRALTNAAFDHLRFIPEGPDASDADW